MSEEMAQPVQVYSSFASYYDAYVGDFQGDFEIYLSLLEPQDRPLEIGCGTGRLLKPALERGYQVTGVDISDDMLDRAREKLSNYINQGQLILFRHDLADAPLQDAYGPVWVSFYTFNYLLDKESAGRFLSNLYRSMRTGALLVMDLFCPSPLLHPELQGQWSQRQITIEKQMITLKDSRTMQDRIEKRIQIFEGVVGKEEIVTFRRFWDKQEMLELLRQSGFQEIEVTDGYDQKGYHPVDHMESTNSSFVVKACKR